MEIKDRAAPEKDPGTEPAGMPKARSETEHGEGPAARMYYKLIVTHQGSKEDETNGFNDI